MSESDVIQILFKTLNDKQSLIRDEWNKLQGSIHDKYKGNFDKSLKGILAFIDSANIKDIQVIALALSTRLIELACNSLEEKSPRRAILLYRAADYSLTAYYKLQLAEIGQPTQADLAKARRELAMLGAQARLAADPRQEDKAFIRDCWLQWRNNPASYPSKAAFARDMLQKCEHLKSQKKIEDWCREWDSNQAS